MPVKIDILNRLPAYVEKLKSVKEIILTNIVLMGQTPSVPPDNGPSVQYPRAKIFLERLSGGVADECTMDAFGNPYAIIKGTSRTAPPIMLVAHMDTTYPSKSELIYKVTGDAVIGPGLLDNSLGVGVLMSLPHLLEKLELSFKSDIVLIGLTESLRQSDLKSIREIMGAWKKPLRGALCIEGSERGRLNYFSNSMIRAEVECDIPKKIGWHCKNGVNAIVVVNEIINHLLEIRLPQRPSTEIIIGQINSGIEHGKNPLHAKLGFEIHSDSDKMVEETFEKVDDICGNVSHQTGVKIQLKRVSSVAAAKLTYHHPLVQSAMKVMEALEISPRFESSESELSVFLSHNIPSIALGIGLGDNHHREDEQVMIESLFKGIVQIIGVLLAIDGGVCDGKK